LTDHDYLQEYLRQTAIIAKIVIASFFVVLWLMTGADLLREKSITSWLLAGAGLM